MRAQSKRDRLSLRIARHNLLLINLALDAVGHRLRQNHRRQHRCRQIDGHVVTLKRRLPQRIGDLQQHRKTANIRRNPRDRSCDAVDLHPGWSGHQTVSQRCSGGGCGPEEIRVWLIVSGNGGRCRCDNRRCGLKVDDYTVPLHGRLTARIGDADFDRLQSRLTGRRCPPNTAGRRMDAHPRRGRCQRPDQRPAIRIKGHRIVRINLTGQPVQPRSRCDHRSRTRIRYRHAADGDDKGLNGRTALSVAHGERHIMRPDIRDSR